MNVWIVCGGNEMGDEDREESTAVCLTELAAEQVQSEMEDEYDWADIFPKTMVD